MSNRTRTSLFWQRVKIVSVLLIAGTAAMFAIVWWMDAPLREARRHLAEGNAERAIEIIESLESQHGSTDAAKALRARCLVELGYHAEAIRLFSSVGAESTEELHAWARAHLHSEQWAQALPLLEAVIERQPSDADTLHELAACCAKLGMLDRAIEYARQFASHPEFRHRGWLMLGMVYRQQGNKAAAEAEWQRISDSDSWRGDLQVSDEEFLSEFGALELELGKASEAEQLLSAAIEINETALTRYRLGLAMELQGDAEKAVQEWKRALILEPSHVEARESLARTALANGQTAAAENYLTPLLADDAYPSSTAYLMQRIAAQRRDTEAMAQWKQEHERRQRDEKLNATITQLLRENPYSYWAIVIRAYEFARDGNWNQAAVMLSTLPKADQQQPFVTQLQEAVRTRAQLPPLDLLPIELL